MSVISSSRSVLRKRKTCSALSCMMSTTIKCCSSVLTAFDVLEASDVSTVTSSVRLDDLNEI